VTRAQRH